MGIHRYEKELKILRFKFEKEERLRKNAIKRLNKAHKAGHLLTKNCPLAFTNPPPKAIAAAVKEFEIAKQELLDLEDHLGENRTEKLQERINNMEQSLVSQVEQLLLSR